VGVSALGLIPRADGRPPVIALLGAHCDDIEIGTGATLLALAAAHPGLSVDATVFTSTPSRAAETRAALAAFLPGAALDITVHELPDGRLPSVWNETKELLEAARQRVLELGDADLVLTPSARDAHQDHRLLGELTRTAFRRHLVLQYEILKWDGDLGRPNLFVPASDPIAARKWELLDEHFVSQRGRGWFDREALLGLMRIRGVECNARYAEAFYADKSVFVIQPNDVNGATPA
jgi:LmbE family N-acetylglucosaminyl deacetylase